jgi:F-type H+-transporting ATPase subunit gamma
MAQSRQAIVNRISSVDSTKKITKAMQLVSSSKLTKARNNMDKNRPYAQGMKDMMSLILSSAEKNNRFLKANEGKPSFIFVVTSDMGLCGGYNANIYRALKEQANPEDQIVIIGSRGSAWAKNQDLNIVSTMSDLNDDTAYAELSKEMERALQLFMNGEIKDIKVLFTHYHNTLTFIPTMETVLPVSKPEGEKAQSGVRAVTIFEPDKESMLETIIPMASKNLLYSDYLESKTSEHASRRMAMESATDNAEELQGELELAYNRIRQGAITQEITEIVGGANALK